MLLRTNLEDLRSSTHTKHYELYRRNKLCEMGFNDDTHSNSFNLQEVYETKRHEHMRNMQDKEDEMRQVYASSLIWYTGESGYNTRKLVTYNIRKVVRLREKIAYNTLTLGFNSVYDARIQFRGRKWHIPITSLSEV